MTSRLRTLRESQNHRNFDKNLPFTLNTTEKSEFLKEKSVNFARYTTHYKLKSNKIGQGNKSNPFLPCLRSLLPEDGSGRCSLPRLKQKGTINHQ